MVYENLQQPECTGLQWTSKHFSWWVTYCRVGGAWFWLSVSFKLLTILYAHIVHTTTGKVYTLTKKCIFYLQIISMNCHQKLSAPIKLLVHIIVFYLQHFDCHYCCLHIYHNCRPSPLTYASLTSFSQSVTSGHQALCHYNHVNRICHLKQNKSDCSTAPKSKTLVILTVNMSSHFMSGSSPSSPLL